MEDKTIIKIGCKQTQLFQRCPRCKTNIRIPKRQVSFSFTPYYYWEFAAAVTCENCERNNLGRLLETGTLSFSKNIKVDIPDDFRRIKTKNGVLYAFNIDMYAKGFFDVIGESKHNYVAVFQDGLQFLQEMFDFSWKEHKEFTNLHRSYFPDGCCNVYTNVDFEGNVETGIEV